MIQDIQIKYFKAIKDSGNIKPGDLTVFIGNNGSGKSSVIEALKTLQDMMTVGLQEAFRPWGGLERVRHYAAVRQRSPISIGFKCLIDGNAYQYDVQIGVSKSEDFYIVEKETLQISGSPYLEAASKGTDDGKSEAKFLRVVFDPNKLTLATLQWRNETYQSNRLFVGIENPFFPQAITDFVDYVKNWQFLNLNAHIMGFPSNQERIVKQVRLKPDGSNIAEFLNRIAEDPEALDAIIDRMKFVLPYVADIRPQIVSELERKVFLEMKESGSPHSIPGWLFSTGTLRILALLAVFSQAELPSVLFIDEVENGLDPRTIGLLLEEIRFYMGENERQVFATTHSPYLLDLLDYRHIIVTEKEEGDTKFHRVDGDDSLNIWKEKFTPGKLYTMGKLNS